MSDQLARWRSLANLHEILGNPVLGKALNEACDEIERLRARDAVASAAWVFADEMRGYCSPHGVAADYADRLEELLRLAESPAAAHSGASAGVEASGGTGEAQGG